MFPLCKIPSIDLQYYIHFMKSDRIQSFSGPYFAAFGLTMERYGVFLRIHSECGECGPEKLRIWTLHAVSSSSDSFFILGNNN